MMSKLVMPHWVPWSERMGRAFHRQTRLCCLEVAFYGNLRAYCSCRPRGHRSSSTCQACMQAPIFQHGRPFLALDGLSHLLQCQQ